jgi:hypothetical protein
MLACAVDAEMASNAVRRSLLMIAVRVTKGKKGIGPASKEP